MASERSGEAHVVEPGAAAAERRVDAVAWGAALGSIVAVALYTWTAVRPVALPWYRPLERGWVVARGQPEVLAMDWYGRVAAALLAGAAVGAGAWLVARRARHGARGFVPVALALNVLAFLALGVAVHVSSLVHRELTPPPPMPFEAADPEARP